MKLHIIFRSCSNNSVHFEQRFIPVSKEDLIIHCLKSLIASLFPIQNFNDFKLSIVDDHSSPYCISQMHQILSVCPFPTEIISLKETGNNASMKYCYEYGLTSPSDVIYFVEDDYLHSPSSLYEMIDSYQLFSKKMRSQNPTAEVAIMPVDNIFHYDDRTIFQSPVVLGKFRHWRVNYYSNWTLMLSKKGLEDNWEHWWKFSDYQLAQPETHEDATLTPVFKTKITLFTPVPTLAFHVASHGHVSPFVNCRDVWDQVGLEWQKIISLTNSVGPVENSWNHDQSISS